MDDIQHRYEARYPVLARLAETIEKEVRSLLEGLPHIDRVYFRAKEPSHFLAKASGSPTPGRAYKTPLTEIEDQVAGRVLVFFLSDVEKVVARLRANFTSVELGPKSQATYNAFGYESFHCVFTIPPQVKPPDWAGIVDPPTTFEMQVRTLFQHAWAEPQHDMAYKGATAPPADALRELAWTAASSWGADQSFERVLKLIKGGR